MSSRYAKVTFVDANPSTSDVRAQELLRSKARSHAAHFSHASTRWANFRLSTSAAKDRSSPTIKHEDDAQEDPDLDFKGGMRALRLHIPMHKGNSDPFTSTAVPYTPLEYSLVKWSRSMQIVTAWPSDVIMRQNMPTMLNAGRRAIGNLVDDPATIHAFLSYSAVHYVAMGRQSRAPAPDPKLVALAKKHSSLALRDLKGLVEVQNSSQSKQGLENVRNAATWLGASDLYSGNLSEAHVHFSAALKIIDMMGGLKSLPDSESGLMIHAVIGLAMLMRSRPLIESDEFDPGPLCQQSFASVITESDLESASNLSQPSAPRNRGTDRCTMASTKQQNLFAEMRELLVVEEYKIQNARSKSEQADQVFRWSHFRKLAVRARNVHYWCDLVDSNRKSTPDSENSDELRASVLEDSFDTCLVHAVRLFDRCIFEEQYSPQGPFPLSKGNYLQLLRGLGDVRARSSHTATDARKYDMLWISSVGAYFENTFLQQRFAVGPDSAPVVYCFTSQFAELAGELRFRDFDELKPFLRTRYLYCSRLQDATLRKSFPSQEMMEGLRKV